MSYAAEVIADSSGKFYGNALRFATSEEAERYVMDLSARWTLVRATRVVESQDPVNYAIVDGKLERLPDKKPESDDPAIAALNRQYGQDSR